MVTVDGGKNDAVFLVPTFPGSWPAGWLEVLWPEVCSRARRPTAGIRLDDEATTRLASEVIRDFIDAHTEPPATVGAAQRWLAGRASAASLSWVAWERHRTGDPNLHRDREGMTWEENPDFDALKRRDADGRLTSREWAMTTAVLRRRAFAVLARIGLRNEDAEDVMMEALSELTRARTAGGHFDKMRVFEELPRLFSIMVERRGISSLRMRTTRKRQASNPELTDSMDAPESTARRTLADPRSVRPHDGRTPWENATFEAIHTSCRTALTDFEWHLLTSLFVEGTHTRLDLANDPWVLTETGLDLHASISKRRRHLNQYIEAALAKLGRALEYADFE